MSVSVDHGIWALVREAQSRGLIDLPSATDSDSWNWTRLVADVRNSIEQALAPPQLSLLNDPADWALAYCARQCGKSYVVARLMVLTAIERPQAVVTYVHQTYAEARNIMWTDPTDGLPAVCRALGIPCDPNQSRLELEFPNGSVIRLMGADRGAWDKLRGQKLDLLVLDEMQKAEDDGLTRALRQVVPDCLAARRGKFRGIGTPDEFCVGTMHDLCVTPVPPWSVAHWTAEDLKDLTSVWAEQLRWKSEHGIADDDPVWLREKRGLWVRQDDRLMLPLTESGLWDGDYPELIPASDGTSVKRTRPFEHHAGLDFGFTDSAALCVCSYSREEGVVREVHSWKSPALDTDALAQVVKAAVDRWHISYVWADSADPKTIEDLANKWRLPVRAIAKGNKTTWIRDMQAKVRTGRLQILRDSVLHTECRVLVPDPTLFVRKKLEPVPGSEDHAFDAMRYAYRGLMSSDGIRPPEPPLTPQQRDQERHDRERDERFGIRKPQVRRDWDRVTGMRNPMTRR